MAARPVNVDSDTLLLSPPKMGEWVPEGHLVHFILDSVGELNLSRAKINGRGNGNERYPPSMMPGPLIYSYATGVFGSRRIERGTYANAAVRVPCSDTHPDHDNICAFRRENAALGGRSFGQTLEMAVGGGERKRFPPNGRRSAWPTTSGGPTGSPSPGWPQRRKTDD